MWQPIRIKFQNLFSHKDTEYFFQKNKCVMIYGRNKTDIDKDSNGGGKSTIMEAITLAVTNQTSRDVGKDDFINEEENSCFVEFELENSIGNVNNLIIRRWFDRKKSTKVELLENGKLNEEMTSVNECNARVYELIGLNREDLIHFFLIGQNTNYSFLTTSDAEKKSIVSRLINIDFIDKKIESLKALSKEKSNERTELEKDVVSAQTRLDVIDEQIEDLKENFETDKADRIETLQNEISELQDKKLSSEKDLIKKKVDADSYSESIKNNKFDEKILKNNNSKIDNIRKEILELEKEVRIHTRKSAEFKEISNGAIQCPKCLTKFLIDSEVELNEIPGKIKVLQTKVTNAKSKIETLEEQTVSLTKEMDKQRKYEEELDELGRKSRSTSRMIEDLSDTIISTEKKIKTKAADIAEIKKETLQKQIDDLKAGKEEWIEIIEVLEEGIKLIDKDIEMYQFWIVNFGKKGFTTFLVNKAIKSIEGITNSYLQKINSNCQIQINGYTQLKSGDVNEKISIEVIEDGFRAGNFLKYSGGEMGRINLANIFGLQYLINMTCPTGGLNLLTLDEAFDGLDRTGQIEIIHVLENMNITSLVVTHGSQPIGAENEIFIEKIDRISRIV